jgi:hypothetical protein
MVAECARWSRLELPAFAPDCHQDASGRANQPNLLH